MKLPRPGPLHRLANIPRIQPAPRHHHDPLAGTSHQLAQNRKRLRRRRFPSRSQHPSRTGTDDILQPRPQIHARIKRPMKSHRQGRGPLHQFPSAPDIHPTLRIQQTQNKSVQSQSASRLNRPPHRRKLPLRIQKIAAPRPDHRKNRNARAFAHATQQFSIRRSPALAQITAQFNTIRSAALRG